MNKRLLRLAFVLVLAAVGSISQGHAFPPGCVPGKACTTNADCGNCTRCGFTCLFHACSCA
jgi:hypothetical protein